jgi:hypothetical protein
MTIKQTTMTALMGISALSLMASASAQDAASGAIERCASEANAELRIACLEAALRGETPAEVSATALQDPTQSTEPPVATVLPALPERVVETPVADAPPPVASASASEAPELGAEQVAARTISRETTLPAARQTFTAVSTRTVPYEKLEVTLANGQVWRQIIGDTQRIRIPRKYRDMLSVEIWEAAVSGYKLRLTDLKRTIRVQRIK